MAAAALGPIGVGLAMGSVYLKSQNEANKEQEMLEKNNEYWDNCFVKVYNVKLSDYYQECYSFCDKITTQYIENFKQFEILAKKSNKLTEYNNYLQSQLIFFVNDEKQIKMREEIEVVSQQII